MDNKSVKESSGKHGQEVVVTSSKKKAKRCDSDDETVQKSYEEDGDDWSLSDYVVDDVPVILTDAPTTLPTTLDPNKSCPMCGNSPCKRILLGKYVLHRTITAIVDSGEWEDYEGECGIAYFEANELLRYKENPATYEGRNVHDNMDKDQASCHYYSRLMPECVSEVFYAFQNFCVKRRREVRKKTRGDEDHHDSMSWSEELKLFLASYDKNGLMH